MIGVETFEVNVYYRDHRFTTLDFHIQRKHSNVSVAEVNAVVKFTHEITVYTMYMLNLCTCQQSNNSFEWISFEWMVSQNRNLLVPILQLHGVFGLCFVTVYVFEFLRDFRCN